MEEKKPRKAHKILKPAEWVKIRSKYEGGRTIDSLSEEYGVSTPTICRRIKKEGWKKLTKVVKTAAAEAVEEAKASIRETYKEAQLDASGRHIKTAKAAHVIASNQLQQYGVWVEYQRKKAKDTIEEYEGKVAEAIATGGAIPPPPDPRLPGKEIYVLDRLVNILARAVDMERLALGMEDMKPDDDMDGFEKLIAVWKEEAKELKDTGKAIESLPVP